MCGFVCLYYMFVDMSLRQGCTFTQTKDMHLEKCSFYRAESLEISKYKWNVSSND